jgi:O-antigen/teichoic acid export membrane protein
MTMRFLHSASLTLFLKGICLIAGLGVSIVIARTLGPEGRGQYTLVMTIVILASTLGSFGLTASGTYFVARDLSRVRAIGFLSLIAGVAGTILSALLMFLLRLWAPATMQGLDSQLLWVTLLFIPVYLWGTTFASAYLGRGDILNFNMFEASKRVLFVALAIPLLWLFSWSLTTYLWFVLISSTIVTVVLMIKYFATAPAGPLIDRSLTTPVWRYGAKSYLACLFTIAAMRVGVLFVNQFQGTAQAGLYSTAQQIMELLIIVPSVLGTVLFGRISDGRSDHLTGKVMRAMILAYLPLVLILFVFAGPIIRVLFGPDFLSATTATRIMLPGSFLLGLEVILVNDLGGRGYPWRAVLIWIPVFVLSVIAYAVLTPRMGLNGAALVTTVSYAVVFVYIAALYRRFAHESYRNTYLPTRNDLSELRLAVTTVVLAAVNACHIGKTHDRARIAHEESTKAESLGASR